MAIFDNIVSLDLENPYRAKIAGLGEIYEIMSVERIRRKMKKKYSGATLHLASNRDHGSRGLSLGELENNLQNENKKILEKGFADSPPWKSSPLAEGQSKKYSSFTIFFAKIIFWFLIRVEFLWQGRAASHMVFVLTEKK
jgi:hypothetical protein